MTLVPAIYDGIEIDMLSLGDADCLIVTRWFGSTPRRVLIDGGCGGDYEIVLDFLFSRGFTAFEAAICSHIHNDHASGLIKLANNRRIATFSCSRLACCGDRSP